MRFFFLATSLAALALLSACSGDDETGSGGGTSTTSGTGASEASSLLPEVKSLGGRVLQSPKVQPILYANDPHAADVSAFLAELASTPYFKSVTEEYGVGPLGVMPIVTRAEAPPKTITDTALKSALNDNTGVGAPWGPTDEETIYLFLLPEGTTIDAEGPCCENFDGFHDQAQVNGVDVPYAVICTCPGFDGPNVSDVQQITVAMSHEIVEASTDPFPLTDPAYAQTDDDHFIWTVIAGGEVADLCTFDPDAYTIPDGSTFMVQRSYSNAAAKLGRDPCLPAHAGSSFLAGAPIATDDISLKGVPFTTRGVKIPVGQKRTIDVQLFGDAKASDMWTIDAIDFHQYFGGPANLALSLDKKTGAAGDIVKLTIEVLAKDPSIGGEAFFIVAESGEASSLVIGAVGN